MALAYLVKIIDGPPARFCRMYESYQESALPKGEKLCISGGKQDIIS